MAAVVQSMECIGEGDALAVLELKPVVRCTLTWTGTSLPCSLARISHCVKVKQTAPLLWVASGLGEYRGADSLQKFGLGEAFKVI